jgi:hypothetical protein
MWTAPDPGAGSNKGSNASVSFTKASAGNQGSDVNTAGKTVGFDMRHLAFTSANTAAVNLTFDTNGGFLYATATVTKSGQVTNGKVTGGPARSREPLERSRSRPSPAPGRCHDHLPHLTHASLMKGGTVPLRALPPCWIKINIQASAAVTPEPDARGNDPDAHELGLPRGRARGQWPERMD